jgi:high-affinity iron transporter
VLASLFITLREGFEAALVVAVILAYLRQLGAPGIARSVWLGVVAAVGVSAAAATGLFLTGGDLTGSAEALFEGVVMLAAVAMLTWMMFWMQRQASTQGARLREHVDAALDVGGALFGLAFLAVLREGLETALFLFAAAGKTRATATLTGALLGLALAGLAGYAVYRGSRRLPLRPFFTVTNIVLVAFAIYLVWRGIGEVGEVIGGDAFEILGPVTALVYGVLAVVGLRRVGRSATA